MILAGIDLETTGLKTDSDWITELGFVIKKHREAKPIELRSFFVLDDGQAPVPEEITAFTKITDEMLGSYGLLPGEVLLQFLRACKTHGVTAFVSQNGRAFDKPFLDRYVDKYLLEKDGGLSVWYRSLPWIDIKVDIDYPKSIRGRNLISLCAEHGFLNPFPHAAVFDAMSTLKILDLYEVEPVLKMATATKITVVADCGYAQRELAKAQGYSFDPAKKWWFKIIISDNFTQEKEACKKAGFLTAEYRPNG